MHAFSLEASFPLRPIPRRRRRVETDARNGGGRRHRSVIRLFRVCAERRPDGSYKAVLCFCQVFKVPEDGV
jgi:hypothetical protein